MLTPEIFAIGGVTIKTPLPIVRERLKSPEFGVDLGGPIPHDSDDETVTVPDTPNPRSRTVMDELQRIMTQAHPSVDYGIERLLQFVSGNVVLV